MEYLSTFALIGGLYLLAAISPGPNFFIITQLSLDGNRSGAIAVAAGHHRLDDLGRFGDSRACRGSPSDQLARDHSEGGRRGLSDLVWIEAAGKFIRCGSVESTDSGAPGHPSVRVSDGPADLPDESQMRRVLDQRLCGDAPEPCADLGVCRLRASSSPCSLPRGTSDWPSSLAPGTPRRRSAAFAACSRPCAEWHWWVWVSGSGSRMMARAGQRKGRRMPGDIVVEFIPMRKDLPQ